MSEKPELAKAYCEAFELHAIELADLIIWADSVISEQAEPNIDFIELALCKKGSDAISKLHLIAKNADEEKSFKLLLGLLYDGLCQGRCEYEPVAKRLYFWRAYETDIEGYRELWGYWNELALANSAQHGEPKQVKKVILEFLRTNMVPIEHST